MGTTSLSIICSQGQKQELAPSNPHPISLPSFCFDLAPSFLILFSIRSNDCKIGPACPAACYNMDDPKDVVLGKQGTTEGQTLYVFFCEGSGMLRPIETE